MNPQGRLIQPSEVADCVMWFAPQQPVQSTVRHFLLMVVRRLYESSIPNFGCFRHYQHSETGRKSALRAWFALGMCRFGRESRSYTSVRRSGMTLPRFDYLSQLYREPDRRMNMTTQSSTMVSGGTSLV
ncbi:MAG: hypothetical protein CM1200mP18_05400 [Gammaproteobacteria bacterium]|nr:MAG: hypothetical protein CM1200mP18_05400 [Gammaproteobacteria bacterium]